MFFGVYDGHGGVGVADLAESRVHKHLLSHYKQSTVLPASRDSKLLACHVAAFEQTDAEIVEVDAVLRRWCLYGGGGPRPGAALGVAMSFFP